MTTLYLDFKKIETTEMTATSSDVGIDPKVFEYIIRHFRNKPTLFPKLHTLYLGCYEHAIPMSNPQAASFCQFLSNTGQIKMIECHNVHLPSRTLESFSNNCTLNSLSFSYSSDYTLPTDSTLQFESLKELSLSVLTCERISEFLDVCRGMPQLEKATFITCDASDHGNTLQSILEALETSCSSFDDFDLTITQENILSLRRFSSLETLRLSQAVCIQKGHEEDIGLFLADATPNLVGISV
jgi:hypothetical protein